MSIDIPSFSDIMEVAANRGDNSENPQAWKGAVGLWPFQESGGATAFDASGYRNHGTLMPTFPADSPTRVVTEMWRALSFDNLNDHIDVDDSESLNITGKELTLSAWIYRKDTSDGILVRKIPGSPTGYQMFVETTLRFHAGAERSLTATAPAINGWHHVVAVANGTTHTIYIDRDNSGSVSSTVDIGSSFGINVRIGAIPGFGYDFYGFITNVRIYNRAQPHSEIVEDYADPWAMYRPRPLMLPAWPSGAVAVGQPTMRRWGGVPHIMPGAVLGGRSW